MELKVGDWIVIDHYGDIWTTKVKEIKDGTCIKPVIEIHTDDSRWYHISRVRRATKAEIKLVRRERKNIA